MSREDYTGSTHINPERLRVFISKLAEHLPRNIIVKWSTKTDDTIMQLMNGKDLKQSTRDTIWGRIMEKVDDIQSAGIEC